MTPLVSVLMTAFNRELYIAEAIQSVLDSTFKDFELIIVDDCSNDGTVEKLKNLEIDKKLISKLFGISDVTITKTYKKILEYEYIIINNKMTETILTMSTNDLSKSKNMKVLSVANYSNSVTSYNSRRIEKVIEFLNTQYDKKITLKDAAKIANMSEVSFSRFFKANTGISFIDNLIDIRLGHASRLLIDTNYSINEIAYSCGFNNISNFNRLFKKKKNYAPKKFREDYTNESRVFI